MTEKALEQYKKQHPQTETAHSSKDVPEGIYAPISLTSFGKPGFFKGSKTEADVKHYILPRQEVINKLRDRGEPIMLFGESELEACKRLRKCELLEPEVNRGFRNDLQEAMDQVDQEYLNELLKTDSNDNQSKAKSDPKEPSISYEEICEMAKKMGRGNREHDMKTTVSFLQVKCLLYY